MISIYPAGRGYLLMRLGHTVASLTALRDRMANEVKSLLDEMRTVPRELHDAVMELTQWISDLENWYAVNPLT